MSDLINKTELLNDLLQIPGVGSNSTAIDMIRRYKTVELDNLDSAVEEIERVLIGNKSRDVEEVYLNNAIRFIQDAKTEQGKSGYIGWST